MSTSAIYKRRQLLSRSMTFLRLALFLLLAATLVVARGTAANSPASPDQNGVTTLGGIIAQQTDLLLVDNDSDGLADPGDTIRYQLFINNDTGTLLNNVHVTDTLDSNLTFVGGSLQTTPIARDDAYNALGNVGINVPAGNAVLANDSDPDGSGGLTIFSFDAISANGGAVTMAGNGSFTYTPATGFSGADMFSYTIDDGEGNQDGAIVTVNVANVIWFIDNSHGGSNNGTLADPFQSVNDFNTLATDAAGDIIFLFETGGGAYFGPIVLLNNQQLIGHGVDLATGAGLTVPPHSNPLPTANVNPTHTHAGDAITVSSNNTIRGLTVGDTNGTAVTGAVVGTLTISDVTVQGTGDVMNVNGGTLNVTFDNISSNTSGGGSAVVDLNNVGGIFAVGGATSFSGINNTGIDLTNAAAGAALDFGATSISGSGAGAPLVNLNSNSAATINFDSLALTNVFGAGLVASNGGTLNLGGATNTINATGGSALDIANSTLGTAWTFSTVSSSGSAGKGINFDTVTGTFTAGGGSISSATQQAIDINAGNGDFTYAGSVTNAVNRAVEVTGRSGNTITLSGNINETGQGLLFQNNSGGTTNLTGNVTLNTSAATAALTLASNAGATVNIPNGNLDIDTSTGTGISATNGGTLTVGGSNNTINTTSGIAINSTGTTFGGVTFQSVSAANSTSGILIDGGGSGGFTVTGSGTTDGSGGAISTMSDRGIDIQNTNNISLSNVDLTNTAQSPSVASGAATCTREAFGNNLDCDAAIYLRNVDNVALTNVDIDGSNQHGINGNDVDGFSYNDSFMQNIGNPADLDNGLTFINLIGTATINNTTITGSSTRNIIVENNAGTATINLFNANIDLAGTEDGFMLVSGGSSNVTVNVSGNGFNQNDANQISFLAEDSSTLRSIIDNAQGANTFTGNTSTVGMVGLNLTARDSAVHNFTVANNTVTPIRSHAINVFISGGGSGNGTISGNTVQGSTVGAGVRAIAEVTSSSNPSLIIAITNNSINNVQGTGLAGIDLRARLGSSTGTANIQATITGNNPVNVTGSADANIQIYNSHGYTVCANIASNAATGVPFFVDSFYVGNPVAGTGFPAGQTFLTGWTGNIDTTWNNNGNTPVNSAFLDGSIQGACTPTAPSFGPLQADTDSPAPSANRAARHALHQTLNAGQPSSSIATSRSTTDHVPLTTPSSLARPAPRLVVTGHAPAAPLNNSLPNVSVDLGSLDVGQSVTIFIDATVNDPLSGNPTQLSSQALVTADGQPPQPSDDPDTAAPDDPTITPLDPPPVAITLAGPGNVITNDPSIAWLLTVILLTITYVAFRRRVT